MGVLDYKAKTLEDLLDGHVTAIEELDLATGKFDPIHGPSIPTDLLPDATSVELTSGMVVARFVGPSEVPVALEQTMSRLLSLLYQRNWTAMLLESTLRPIDIRSESKEFQHEIAMRILEAMRARYVSIGLLTRSAEAPFLRCHAFVDSRTSMPEDELSVFDAAAQSPEADLYRSVQASFVERREYLRLLERSEHAALFAHLAPSTSTRTIVVAVLSLGEEVLGFVNVGYDVDLRLNGYLAQTFATAFNHMSIAIANRQTMDEIAAIRSLEFGEWLQSSNLEFLQGFRHVAQNELLSADIARRKMLANYTYKGDSNDDPAIALAAAHTEMSRAFGRMAAFRRRSDKKEVVSLPTVLEEATKQVTFQLDRAGASVRSQVTGSVTALVNVQLLRDALGNLILNSIEAFEQANTKKQDRRITVNFRKEHDLVTIDFSDEGPGVRIGGNIRSTSDIWLPEKTSKPKGTGYGLPFVRRIIQDEHRGSIDLRESKRGAHFRILLRDERQAK